MMRGAAIHMRQDTGRSFDAIRALAALLAAASIAGCSGGGGGSLTSTSPAVVASSATFPIDTAYANLVKNGFQATLALSGNAGAVPVSGSGSYSWAQASSSTFENQSVYDTLESLSFTLTAAGNSQSSSDTQHQYFDSRYAFAGELDSDGTYYVPASMSAWPSAAKVGDSGSRGSITLYSDSSKTTVTGYEQLSYRIEADTATTAILTVVTVDTDTNNAPQGSEEDRYRVTPAGDISYVSSTFVSSSSGISITVVLTATSAQSPGPTPPAPPTPSPAPSPTPPLPPTPLPVLSQSVAYHVDPAHTGRVAYGQPLNLPATPTWSVQLPGAVSYPLIAGSKVFITTAGTSSPSVNGTQLYALDEASGNVVWGPLDFPGTYNWSAHAYDNGKVFIVNSDGLLRCYDASTGTAGWSVRLPGQTQFNSPPTAVNGIVYVAGEESGGTLYAVDETNGAVLWTAAIDNGASSPTISNEGVFVSFSCGVYKFDPLTGATLWHYRAACSGGGGNAATYASGLLYVRALYQDPPQSGEVFDTTSGTQVGTYQAGPIPAIGDQTGFFLYQGTLRGIDLTSHNVLWSFAGDGNLGTEPIIVDQVVFIASSSGVVYALGAATGAQIWSGNAGASILTFGNWLPGPSTGIAAGEGYLVVPAGSTLTAWHY